MLRYKFETVTNCEMCDDPVEKHKIVGQRLNSSQGLQPKSKKGISVTVQRCRNCGLIYSNPMPVPFDIADHYNIPPESYWHPSYFIWEQTFSKQLETFKRLTHFYPGMKFLDIGAGIGKCMKSMGQAGFDTYGFEPSQAFYERAISIMGLSPDKLKLGQMENIEYEPETFDFISFGAVFEHLYHPRKALEKAMGWLKKGGIIHIEVPNSRHLLASFIDVYYRSRGTNYTTHLSPMHVPFHLYEFHLNSFEKLSSKLDYSIIHKEYMIGTIFNFPKILHPPLRQLIKFTNRGLQLIVWLKKN